MELVNPAGPPLKNLSGQEKRLIESVAAGVVIEFNQSVVIRSELIAHLVKESYKGWPVKSGIRMSGATITGYLDLEGCHCKSVLALTNCHFEDDINLFGFSIQQLFLLDCTFKGKFEGSYLRSHVLNLNGSSFDDNATLTGATLIGSLSVCEAHFLTGLSASHLTAATVDLQGTSAQGVTDLSDARVKGDLRIHNAQLGKAESGGLYARGASVGSLSINNSTLTGSVDLTGVQVSGDVNLSSCNVDSFSLYLSHAVIHGTISIRNISGSNILLWLDKLTVDRDIDLLDFTEAMSCSVFMDASRIDGSLNVQRIRVDFINAENACVGGNVLLSGVFASEVNMPGMTINGSLDMCPFMVHKLLDKEAGINSIPLVDLSGARIAGNLSLNPFTNTLGSSAGASGPLQRRGAPLVATFLTAPILLRALILDRAIIEGQCHLVDGQFPEHDNAESDGKDAEVLSRISAVDAQFHRLIMPATCPAGVVDLSNASADSYEDFSSGWPRRVLHCGKRKQSEEISDTCSIVLNGFVYRHLVNPRGTADVDNDGITPVWSARLLWLDSQPGCDLVEHFKPQPWSQLAKTLLLEGYEDDARRISIERRVSYRYSKGPRKAERAVSSILHLLADYGYNPWKTIVWCIVFIAAFGGIFHVASLNCLEPGCHDATVYVPVVAGDVVTSETGDIAKIYPAFGAWHYSLDLFIPIFDLGMESYWHANTAYKYPISMGDGQTVPISVGLLLDWLSVIERIFGALMVALSISGFTGLLTRGD